MLTLNTILCPVDFSEASNNAVHFAAEFARNSGAEIVLLHVLPMTYILPYDAYTVPLTSLEETKLAADKELDLLIQSLKVEIEDLKVTKEMVTGNPADGILEKARQHKADLIIMGSHGRTGLKRLLLGSVAEIVLREADCPALIVKANKDETIV